MATLTYRAAHGAADTDDLLSVHTARAAADGVHPYSNLEYRPNRDGCNHELEQSDPRDWVIAEADRNVVGYGHALYDWPENDGKHVYLHLGWVMPEWRRQGVGTDLLARLEARCRERAQTAGRTDTAEFGANAGGADEAALSLLKENGYFVAFTMQDMEFVPGRQPAPETLTLPSGYELRIVQPEHFGAIWQCIGDAYFYEGDNGRFRGTATEAGFRRYFLSQSADPKLWFVAWRGSRVAGHVLCRIENGKAEIYEVSVGHEHRRKGLARALLSHALLALQSQSPPVTAILVQTRREFPTQAWRLYEQAGFRPIATAARLRKSFSNQGMSAEREEELTR